MSGHVTTTTAGGGVGTERRVRTIGEHVAAVLARVSPVPAREAVPPSPGGGDGVRWLPLDVVAVTGPGLVLADDVVATSPVPGFDHAAVDGYAVRLTDVRGEEPVTLQVAGAVRAGDAGGATLGAGQAVRVMTGAPVPPGADAVVPVEATSTGRFVPGRDGDEPTVALTRSPKANIRRRGEDIAVGAVLATRGHAVSPALIAAAAAAGVAGLRVRAVADGTAAARSASTLARAVRPRVAVVSTGSELHPAGTPLAAGGVTDSNSLMLAAVVEAAGAEPLRLGGVPDDDASLRAALDEAAADADLIVTTGGVSAGAWDVVRQVLLSPDGPAADPDLTGVAMRPGRPQGVATWRGVPWVALPGTPVAAFVSAHLFVRPAIARLRGHDMPPTQRRLVVTDPDVAAAPPPRGQVARPSGWPDAGGRGCGDLVRVVPVRSIADGVAPTAGGGRALAHGHALSALLDADGLALVPPGGVAPGNTVEVVPL